MKRVTWLLPVFILLFIACTFLFPAEIGAVAKFDYSDLTISEHFVYANEEGNGETTVYVTVTNTGDESGAYVVQLKLNDVLETPPDPITLEPGEQKKVQFSISKPVGEYTVTAGTLEKTENKYDTT